MAACAWKGAYVFSGGHNGATALDSVYKFQDKKWEQMPSLLNIRHNHTMAAVGHSLYVLGGYRTDIEMLDECLSQFCALTFDVPIRPKACTNAVVLGKKILLFGGDMPLSMSYDTGSNKVTMRKTQLHQKYEQSHVALLKIVQ